MDHCPEEIRCHPLEGGFECISDCKEGEYKDKITFTVGSNSFTEYNCVSNYVVEDTNECMENCNKANTVDHKYYYYFRR